MARTSLLTRWLEKAPLIWFSLFATIAAFCTYSCMYAFRKPYAVADFKDLEYCDVDFKILLITAQVIGYTLSKFIGIKVVAEMTGKNRGLTIVGLILTSGLALLLFPIIPPPYNLICLFLNGLPLGMVWGLVFAYLEGRRTTEILGAGLCVTFIISSGFVKSVGAWVMLTWGISEFWMPVTTAGIFTIPLFISVWLLDKIPPPTQLDEELRTKREPMNGAERMAFFKRFMPGLILLILVYALLTAYRDFRDNFARELWDALGYGGEPSIFTLPELLVALGILLILGSTVFIRNNWLAFRVNLILILIGAFIVGIAAYAFQHDMINGVTLMVLVGLGSYMGYIPFNAMLFERLIAAFKYISNVGFVIYLADAFGYLSSVGLLFYKNFGAPDLSWLDFFLNISYVLTFGIAGLMVGIFIYFRWRFKSTKPIIEQ